MDDSSAAPDLEIVGNQVTIQHAGFTGGPEQHDEEDGAITERHLVRNMARFRERPLDFLREVSLYMSGTGWRAYEDVVGQPIYYPGYSERVKSLMLKNPILRNRVKELAEARLAVEEEEGLLELKTGSLEKKREKRRKEIEGNLHQVVDTMMDNMICKMDSKRFIRGAYYLATQLLTRAYHHGELFCLLYGYTIHVLIRVSCRHSCIQRRGSPFTICRPGSC